MLFRDSGRVPEWVRTPDLLLRRQTGQRKCLESVAAEVRFRHAEAALRALIAWAFVRVMQVRFEPTGHWNYMP